MSPSPRQPPSAPARRRWSLRDLRLRKRLVLLVLVPLAAGVALASARVASEATTISSVNDLNGQAQVAVTMAGLVYAVEDERDAVEVYLTDGGQGPDMAALSRAEADTEAHIAQFDGVEQTYAAALAVLPSSDQMLRQQAVARLGDLTTLRASVTSLGAGRPIYQAYTTIVGDLLNFSGQLATDTTDHDLATSVSTLGLVEQLGEQTSQERGYLVGILGGGGQLLAQQEDLVQAQAQYNSTLADLDAQAAAPVVDLYQAQVGGDQTGAADSTVQQAIDAALQDFPVSEVQVTDTDAFTQTTAKVQQVRGIERVVAQDILGRTSALLSQASRALYMNVGIIVGVLLFAFVAIAFVARSITQPLRVLRVSALEIAGVRLPAVIERLRDPRQAQTNFEVEPIPIDTRDEIGSVARAFEEVHLAAVHLASEQAMLRSSVNAVFTNLSRRSQTLVERQLQLIDDLESGEREPGRLAQLFRLDHLATRMRRNNENLLVLAGEETARRWTEAVRLVDVARAAAAEVEQYERIILGEMPRVGIAGKAAPDVAHLVAELLENATAFSAPRTKVWIAARMAEDSGVVLRIEDAGLGMKRAEFEEANERMNNPPVIDVSVARRMGLYVVGRLAARYGIEVRLGESQAGGVAALIHLPVALLSEGADQVQPDTAQVDDEFYALSRQFAHAAAVPVPPIPFGAARLDQRFGAMPGVVGTLAGMDAPSTGAVWFQPSEDRKPGEGDASKRSAADAALARAAQQEGLAGASDTRLGAFGRSAAAARRQQPPSPFDAEPQGPYTQEPQSPYPPEPPPGAALPKRPLRHVGRAAPEPEPVAPAAAPLERTPIFEAIESEWFRRRDEARAAYLNAVADTVAPAAPEASQTTAYIPQQAGAPEEQATVPAPTISPAAVVRSWSSPGDEGWRAAQALADPASDGRTASGLPRRTPRANLVPGAAGGVGAARAVPPPHLRHDPSPGGRP
ncbi:sensor histidine kinase [Actinospica durhamensis]|uniref:histidine kinase n=1 Tax=Actinospica durhamensis TaxID=1508375 RepID=A0A941EVP4_9ACTN|nr:nitrate- and nitrite sensing domain-containing protein [Actinospica durhamensis]MBR7838126.1 sensor histidine kinase [Actinospica durhamensis]